jgi:hypothetical protein
VAKKETLRELGLSASTYHRQQRLYREQGIARLVDQSPQPGMVWNRMKPTPAQNFGSKFIPSDFSDAALSFTHSWATFRQDCSERSHMRDKGAAIGIDP